ncbi:carbohydrate ABC transporter permease [Candidatus Phytoplasma phoenicium]|uniref:Glycerol-3-phosphate ABC transporter, permease 2 n=1 Tax=Candidatus Phytoplasma phoenicium TaxID=198422 RepID=A0A0L0MJS8_9MOLU|nr:carbohydrate ABC transporter permease [Candidatus Phytoplasma phoenicium]KND62550.1 Glycerol-3-phosphate ABC transporter, permease 2 [Candidatus Phytoplasma phoenicium]
MKEINISCFFKRVWNSIKKKYKSISFFAILKYSFLFFISCFLTLAFYAMFIMSLKNNDDIINNNILSFPKNGWHWENYLSAFQAFKFFRYLWNTCLMVFFSTLFGTIICIITAFALTMFEFPLKNVVFKLLLLGLMITSETLILTNYRTVANWGMVNAGYGTEFPGGVYFAMTLPYLINIVHILILIRAFQRVPKELYYTSKIDGATDWYYLWKILVPITKATIIITVIFRIVAAWNAYAWPELVGGELLTNMARKTFNNESGIDAVNIQMAIAVLINLPLFFIFIFFKKYIVSGENSSGIKG